MNTNIPDIYNSLQEIALHFGNHGINGECCGDLSLIEFMALKKVNEKNSLSIQEIGAAINFTKSGATRIIDRLESKGYVIRERSLEDGRICCVTVTADGKKTISNIMDKYTTYLNEVLKDLDPQMVDKIKDALDVLVKSVQLHEFI